jgi:hypothetical protein
MMRPRKPINVLVVVAIVFGVEVVDVQVVDKKA